MNNEKVSGFKRNHAGGDEKLVVNKINVCLSLMARDRCQGGAQAP